MVVVGSKHKRQLNKMEISSETAERVTAELTAAIETRIAPALIQAITQEAIGVALEAFEAVSNDTPGYVELITEVAMLRARVKALENENSELAAKLAVFKQQAQLVTHRVVGIVSENKSAKKKSGGATVNHKLKKAGTAKHPPSTTSSSS
jgi:hypothetical protein